jgi:hypothetical protein
MLFGSMIGVQEKPRAEVSSPLRNGFLQSTNPTVQNGKSKQLMSRMKDFPKKFDKPRTLINGALEIVQIMMERLERFLHAVKPRDKGYRRAEIHTSTHLNHIQKLHSEAV